MKKILFITALSFITFSSCKKKGCIDANAKNYDVEAGKDDGTCTYEGSAVFWLSSSASLINYPTIDINVYVDGEKVGKLSGSGTLNAPNCGEGGMTYYVDLGSTKDKVISYEIKYTAQTGVGAGSISELDYSSGSTKLIGGQCKQISID